MSETFFRHCVPGLLAVGLACEECFGLAFMISPLADNLTTALLMGAVVMAVGGDNKKFVIIACINVVAANAGGAFSPFGDITTLMVWQEDKVQFTVFFAIFLPSLVNWLIPAAIMSLTDSKERPLQWIKSLP